MRFHLLVLLIVVLTQSIYGQLSTEITVDRTVLPQLPMANKPTISPLFSMPQASPSHIDAVDYILPGHITNDLSIVKANGWQDSIAPSANRGHITAGYFPALYFGIDAGYKFLRTPTAYIDAWLKYKGSHYDSPITKEEMGTNRFDVGANAAFSTSPSSIVSFGMVYSLSSARFPEKDTHRLSANEFAMKAGWQGKSDVVQLHFDAKASYLGFNITATEDYKPLSQTDVSFLGGIGFNDGSDSSRKPWANLDLEARWLYTTKGYGTQGTYYLRPYCLFDLGNFLFKAGLELSAGSGLDNSGIKVAPDINISYAPEMSLFASSLSVSGGRTPNPLSNIYAISPYLDPSVAYGSSNVPCEVTFQISLGRWKGMKFIATGSWSVANDWLMPTDGYTFATVDFNSWKIDLAANYSLRSWATIEMGYAFAGSNKSPYTWRTWHDSAKSVLHGCLTLTPITRLRASVGANYRMQRGLLSYSSSISQFTDLDDVLDIYFSANYDLSSRLSVFAKIDNILSRRPLLISGLPDAPIHGLIGVSYKF